ncbi:hypothetical protein AwDysgo_21100 [Bacteroidales bacterium]|nr:hypothetical protein AwDysgo_21100 [Bacteroidales bacterium]
MRTLGNLLWLTFCFGWVPAIWMWLFGLLLTLTVVAAPVGLGFMQLGKFLFWPCGNSMTSKDAANIEQNPVWKGYSTIVMILYFPFGLIYLIAAIVQIIVLCFTVLGIPIAMVIAKSLSTYLNPVNKICVSSDVVYEINRRKAQAFLAGRA